MLHYFIIFLLYLLNRVTFPLRSSNQSWRKEKQLFSLAEANSDLWRYLQSNEPTRMSVIALKWFSLSEKSTTTLHFFGKYYWHHTYTRSNGTPTFFCTVPKRYKKSNNPAPSFEPGDKQQNVPKKCRLLAPYVLANSYKEDSDIQWVASAVTYELSLWSIKDVIPQGLPLVPRYLYG